MNQQFSFQKSASASAGALRLRSPRRLRTVGKVHFYELPVEAAEHTISRPEWDTEFELQAAIFAALRGRGVDVRGEVPHRGGFDAKQRRLSCRFDLVVFVEGRAACVIEVKSDRKTGNIEGRRQGNRYTRFGVPVLVCVGSAGVAPVVQRAAEIAATGA